MNGYGRRYGGRYMPQQPPSPWSHFLGGLGTGITKSLDRLIQEKERKRSMTDQVLESVIQGDFDPRVLATEEGRDWAIRNLKYKSPEIQKLMFQGQIKANLLGPGGMGPPEPYQLSAHQETLREEIEAEKEEKFKKELEQIERKERLRLQIKKEAQPSPEKIAEIQKLLSEHGLAPENITVNIDGVNYDLQTALEKAETVRKLAEKKKGGKESWDENYQKYLAKGSDYREKRTRLVNAIATIGTGEEMPEVFNKFPALAALLSKSDKAPPEERRRIAIRETNKNIAAWNREMENEAKRLKLKPGQYVRLGKIKAETLEEIEPPEPVTDEQKRNVIVTPKSKDEETVDPSEVLPTEAFIINSAGEKMVARGGKWVKVKKSY